jgi:hypothetical protein
MVLVVVPLGVLLRLKKTLADLLLECIPIRSMAYNASVWATPSWCGRREGGGCPYTNSNGVARSAEWYEVL